MRLRAWPSVKLFAPGTGASVVRDGAAVVVTAAGAALVLGGAPAPAVADGAGVPGAFRLVPGVVPVLPPLAVPGGAVCAQAKPVAATLIASRFLAIGVALGPSMRGGTVRRALEGQAVVDASLVLADPAGAASQAVGLHSFPTAVLLGTDRLTAGGGIPVGNAPADFAAEIDRQRRDLAAAAATARITME